MKTDIIYSSRDNGLECLACLLAGSQQLSDCSHTELNKARLRHNAKVLTVMLFRTLAQSLEQPMSAALTLTATDYISPVQT